MGLFSDIGSIVQDFASMTDDVRATALEAMNEFGEIKNDVTQVVDEVRQVSTETVDEINTLQT